MTQPLEDQLKQAYYYTEAGEWRGPEVDEWDRWHAVAKVAASVAESATVEPVQEPHGEPVAWNQTAYAALQQARLALEDLDGPGYLIGGVMHHRIGLILPMLNAAMESLIDHPPQQRKPLTNDQIIDIGNEEHRAMPAGSDEQDELLAIARAVERAHGIGEAPSPASPQQSREWKGIYKETS